MKTLIVMFMAYSMAVANCEEVIVCDDEGRCSVITICKQGANMK